MKSVISPNDRLLSIDELDRDIGDLSTMINNPSAEGLLSGMKTLPASSPPP